MVFIPIIGIAQSTWPSQDYLAIPVEDSTGEVRSNFSEISKSNSCNEMKTVFHILGRCPRSSNYDIDMDYDLQGLFDVEDMLPHTHHTGGPTVSQYHHSSHGHSHAPFAHGESIMTGSDGEFHF